VSHVFLSEEWFAAVQRIRSEVGELELPADLEAFVVNVEVSGGPQGSVEAHLYKGALERGFAPRADATLRMPYALAQRAFLGRDASALISAYLSGELRAEGDFTRLLALQRTAQAPTGRALLERIAQVTA
jgi:hypothetical protein